MKSIYGKVISETTSTKGYMFQVEDTFSLEDLMKWVYRNCPNCDKIETDIDKKEVSAVYDTRYEIYSIVNKTSEED